MSESQILKYTANIPPTNTFPGDVWVDTSSGNVLMSTGTGITNVGTSVVTGGIGAHSHTIVNNNSISWASISNLEPTYSFKAGDRRVSMTEKEISKILTDKEELDKLCIEQPSVQEAFTRLQTLIKLYRE